MLEMRPNCESCGADLPPDAEARICSYECTFCVHCAEEVLDGVCPNCGGILVTRPPRPPKQATPDGAICVLEQVETPGTPA